MYARFGLFLILCIIAIKETYSQVLICPEPPATGLEQENTCNDDGDCAPGQRCCQATLERNTKTCKRALTQGRAEKGEKGDQGPDGPPGETGAPGAVGQPGQPGREGSRGDNGNPGNPGLVGDPGEPGLKGVKGADGPAGLWGPAGDDGSPGEGGVDGEAGLPGNRGRQGVQGSKGARGATGEVGEVGAEGAVGDAGDASDAGRDERDDKLDTAHLICGKRYLKQCTARNLSDGRDTGEIMTCNFTKTFSRSSLRLTYEGDMRFVTCQGACCGRWYLTINGKECSSPAQIDAVIYSSGLKDLNFHRPGVVDGLCDGIPKGPLTVGLSVGKCAGFPGGNAFTCFGSTCRILVEEILVY